MPDLKRTVSQTTRPLNIKNRPSNFKNLTGNLFGRLRVISLNEFRNHRSFWICECSCGKTVTIMGKRLTNGHTKSCGCLARDVLTKRNFKHGHSTRKNQSPEYKAWCHIKDKCFNSDSFDFYLYGARGISVCSRWSVFSHFLADMGLRPSSKHSIDRIDNDGNYEPGNCRWATSSIQANNKRTNRILSLNGKSMTMIQWANHLSICYGTLRDRIRRGWTHKRALTTPVD